MIHRRGICGVLHTVTKMIMAVRLRSHTVASISCTAITMVWRNERTKLFGLAIDGGYWSPHEELGGGGRRRNTGTVELERSFLLLFGR